MEISSRTIVINPGKISLIGLFTTALILFIIGFPAIDPEYGIGLDTSYVWAYNHLFANHSDILTQLVYPIGPLGFLRMPVTIGNNLLIALLFFILLKMGTLMLFIKTSLDSGHSRFTSVLLAGILSMYSAVDYLLIGLAALFSFKYLTERGWYNIISGALIALLALLIKTSIGVCAGFTVLMSLVITAVRDRSAKEIGKDTLFALIVIIIFGSFYFQSLTGFINYFYSSFKFSIGFSGALSIPSPLSASGLFYVVLCFPLTWYFIRDEKFRHTWWMLLPALFAAWKHGLSRQDVSHGTQFLYFMILYWCLLYAFNNVRKAIILVFGIFCLVNFNSQLQLFPDYKGFHLKKDGWKNFNACVLHFKNYSNEWNAKSAANLANARIDESTSKIIGNATVDTYPWELSYIYNLNWKPRRTLQSGSFAPWLEDINAEDFNLTNGPQFIIWHYVNDLGGSNLASIDNRYLLNENPNTILELFRNYRLREKTSRYLLLEKITAASIKEKDLSSTAFQLNEWQSVPDAGNDLLRMQLALPISISDKLRGLLYQPAEYYIDYRLDDFRVMTYRFNTEMAKEGLWLNPFMLYADIASPKNKVQGVRIRSNRDNGAKCKATFVSYNFTRANTPYTIQQFFDQNNSSVITDSIIFNQEKSFAPGEFSATYRMPLDSLWKLTTSDTILVEADALFQAPATTGAVVISVEESPNNDYRGRDFVNLPGYAFQSVRITRTKQPTGKLVIYTWNQGKEAVVMRGLRVCLR
jgi:hypothetical protein